MDLLHSMRVFAAVVEQGSLARAAEGLDLSAAAVSRQVAALEDHLGARLLHRTTRRLSLTEVGEAYFARAKAILAEVDEAAALASDGARQAVGTLRISAPLPYAVHRLARWLPEFQARHPGLRLDLDLTDRPVDLASDGIDVAVRIARHAALPNVIARRIGTVRRLVCAAPDYLSRRGAPRHPEDLAAHDCLAFSGLAGAEAWSFRRGDELRQVPLLPVVRASSGDVLCAMAAEGAGVICEPDFMVARLIAEGRLVALLPDWPTEEFGIFALYLTRRHLPVKVRLFIEVLQGSEQV